MKRRINSLGIGLMVVFALYFTKQSEAQPGVRANINFQTFYDELSPHGDWIDYPEYGYTWRPRVGNDFRPYATNGYWMHTNEYNWMWNSGYDWGWAPFHYGRWFQDPQYGWLWVPGYDWSPAWVSWRGGGDYYGWAPIRPGVSISVGFGGYNPPYDYWTFAPCRYMTSRYIGRYYHPFGNNVSIFNRTTVINNYYGNRGGSGRGRYYTNGPRRAEVERYTGRRINSVNVRSSSRPGRASVSRNSVSVYRPRVQRGNDRSSYAPRNVSRYERSGSVANNGSLRNRGTRVNTSARGEGAVNRSNNGAVRRDVRTNRSSAEENRYSSGSESRSRTEAMQQRPQQRIQRSPRGNESEPRRRMNEARSRRNTEMQQQNRTRQIEARQQRGVRSQSQREYPSRGRQMGSGRQPGSGIQSRPSSRSRSSIESRSSGASNRSATGRSQRGNSRSGRDR